MEEFDYAKIDEYEDNLALASGLGLELHNRIRLLGEIRASHARGLSTPQSDLDSFMRGHAAAVLFVAEEKVDRPDDYATVVARLKADKPSPVKL